MTTSNKDLFPKVKFKINSILLSYCMQDASDLCMQQVINDTLCIFFPWGYQSEFMMCKRE